MRVRRASIAPRGASLRRVARRCAARRVGAVQRLSCSCLGAAQGEELEDLAMAPSLKQQTFRN
eukprot:6209652-Prymnesium_polylepis.2